MVYGAYGVLAGLKEAIQYGLVFAALIAALFATRLLREPSQIEVRAEARRLIAMKAPDEVSEILKSHNHAVRRAEGTTSARLGDSVLTWLDPAPGSAETEQTLLGELGNSVTSVIRPSTDSEAWNLQMAEEPETLLEVDRWPPQLEGCDQRILVINELYGPVACASPLGTIIALDGSPGVPGYAQELLLTDIPSARLVEILHEIEQTFRLEARLTVLNEGESTAKGVQVVAPPGWTVPESWEPGNSDPRCNDTGETGDRGFSLGALNSCVVTYVTLSNSRDALPLTPPTFTAVAQTPPLIDVVIWILGLALILMVLYFVADILVNWSKRTGKLAG